MPREPPLTPESVELPDVPLVEPEVLPEPDPVLEPPVPLVPEPEVPEDPEVPPLELPPEPLCPYTCAPRRAMQVSRSACFFICTFVFIVLGVLCDESRETILVRFASAETNNRSVAASTRISRYSNARDFSYGNINNIRVKNAVYGVYADSSPPPMGDVARKNSLLSVIP